jgi:hypothetical protein
MLDTHGLPSQAFGLAFRRILQARKRRRTCRSRVRRRIITFFDRSGLSRHRGRTTRNLPLELRRRGRGSGHGHSRTA